MFEPHFEILPPAQKALWPELVEIPQHFILYGGTALALRLGHRQSLDFDFFSSNTISPRELITTLPVLQKAKIIQNTSQTLTVSIERGDPVKLSFFGGISFGRVGQFDKTPDGILNVASLLDLAGTKAAVISQRAEAKDYLDMLAIVTSGIPLAQAMAAAQALYGEQYNPMLTLKALTFFDDGDLHKLTAGQKAQLLQIASKQSLSLPKVQRLSDHLSS